jgi:hypothetical protein
MKTAGTTPFFAAVMATTSQAAVAAIPDAVAAQEADAAPPEEPQRLRINMPTAPVLAVAARSFHASVTDGLGPDDIPASVRDAFETVRAHPSSSESAREYFSAVERVIGEEILRSAQLMVARRTVPTTQGAPARAAAPVEITSASAPPSTASRSAAAKTAESAPAEAVAPVPAAAAPFDLLDFFKRSSAGLVHSKDPGTKGDFRSCSVFRGSSIPAELAAMEIDSFDAWIGSCGSIWHPVADDDFRAKCKKIFRWDRDRTTEMRVYAFPSGTFKTDNRFVNHLAGRDFLYLELPTGKVDGFHRDIPIYTYLSVPSGHLDDIIDSFDHDPEVLVTLYEELFGDFATTVGVKKSNRLTIGSPSETRTKVRTKDGWTSV